MSSPYGGYPAKKMARGPPGRLIHVICVKSPILIIANYFKTVGQRKEVSKFKDDLAKYCGRYKKSNRLTFEPSVNDVVAVYVSEEERWERGQIQCIYNRTSSMMYDVFLIDDGEFVTTHVRDMCPLSDESSFLKVPPQVLQIGLCNVLPAKWPAVRTDKSVDEWSSFNIQFVEDLLFDKQDIYFEEITKMNGIHFGNVIIECGGEFQDLATELCNRKILSRTKSFAKDIEHFYGWVKENSAAEIPLQHEKRAVQNVPKEIDVTKASVAEIKEWIIQKAARERKETDSTASSSSRKEEYSQEPSFSNSTAQGWTPPNSANTSSDNSFTKYTNDVMFAPHGCTLDIDVVKKKKEGGNRKSVGRGKDIPNRYEFFNGIQNIRDMDRAKMNSMNRPEVDHVTSNANRSPANNTKDTSCIEMNKRDADRSYASTSRDADWSQDNNVRGMNRPAVNKSRGTDWSQTKNKGGTSRSSLGNNRETDRSQTKNKGGTSRSSLGNNRETDRSQNKNRGDTSRSSLDNNRETDRSQTKNRGDTSRSSLDNNRETDRSQTKNKGGTSRSSLGNNRETDRSQTKNRRDTSRSSLDNNRETDRSQNKNRGDTSRSSLDNNRETDRSQNKNRGDTSRPSVDNSRETDWSQNKSRGGVNRPAINSSGNTNLTETKTRGNTHQAETYNKNGAHQTDTNNRQSFNQKHTNNEREISRTDTHNRQDKDWSGSANRGDTRQTGADNNKIYSDKSDFSHHNKSANSSSYLSSIDVNKNHLYHSKQYDVEERPNQYCTGSNTVGITTQAGSAQSSPKSNVIGLQENVSGKESIHSDNVNRSVCKAPVVQTNAVLPNALDTKALSKLSMKDIKEALRHRNQNIRMSYSCSNQAGNKLRDPVDSINSDIIPSSNPPNKGVERKCVDKSNTELNSIRRPDEAVFNEQSVESTKSENPRPSSASSALTSTSSNNKEAISSFTVEDLMEALRHIQNIRTDSCLNQGDTKLRDLVDRISSDVIPISNQPNKDVEPTESENSRPSSALSGTGSNNEEAISSVAVNDLMEALRQLIQNIRMSDSCSNQGDNKKLRDLVDRISSDIPSSNPPNKDVEQKCVDKINSTELDNIRRPDEAVFNEQSVGPTKSENLRPSSASSALSSNSKEASSSGSSSAKPKKKYLDSTYFSYNHKIPVLLHGDSVEPILSVSEMTQDNYIFECLRTWKVRDVSLIQTYACPIISARRDSVIVSTPRSGKSLAYIVPILTMLRNKTYYSKLRAGNGPRAVFIVSCSDSAEQVYSMCKELLEPLQDLSVCITYGGGAEMEVKDQLVNGCDILISTPRCLLRLLEIPYLTGLNRVCHMVLDEADILLDNFVDELKKLLILLKKAKSSHSTPVQSLIVSNKWNLILEDLVRQILNNPVLCIASYLEAAVYARVKPVVSILKPGQKIHKLVELLKSQSTSIMKTVILCNRKEDVMFVKQSIEKSVGVSPLAVHEGIDIMCSESVMMDYWGRDSPVVVCSDTVLPELNILDANCLVHFGLPETKKQFNYRFSCLLMSYRNILKHQEKQKCETHIFVDEDNENQFPEIMKFMERLGTSVPLILEEIVKKINVQKEKSKGDVEFCEKTKEFGKCWDANKCPSRHTLNSEWDQPKNLPLCGRVKLQILHVYNACHYAARILEHSPLDTWVPVPSDYLELAMQIGNYYSDPENRCLHGIPKVGDLVAVETTLDIFERAQVLKILKYNYNDEVSVVLCRLIDTGIIGEYETMQLKHLPEQFCKQKREAVDIYLCQLLPVDLDKNWSTASKTAVKEWIERIQQQEDSFIIGKIVVNIADSLWLEPLEHVKWLPLTKTLLSQFSFRDRLLKINLAVENKTHLDRLFQLCKDAEIDVPYNRERKSGKTKEETTEVKCQWAHLPRDEYTAVRMITAKSLDMIFLHVYKFQDRLERLQKDIQAAVNTKEKKFSYPSLQRDDVCLAKYEDDDEWYRAQVVDDPTEQELKLFFVDYGDFETVTWDNVCAIPMEIITRLPFQIIECSLAGVIPIDDEEANAVDLLYDLTEEPESNVPKTLYARVCNLELKAQKTGGRRYSVVLVDKQNGEDVVINKEFVLKGFGNWHPKEKHFLNNLPPAIIESSDESELCFSDDSSETTDVEDSGMMGDMETSPPTSNELVPSNGVHQRSREEMDKVVVDLMRGMMDGSFEIFRPDTFQSSQQNQEKSDRVCIQEISEDVSTGELNDWDTRFEQTEVQHNGETTDGLNDVRTESKQSDSGHEEYEPKVSDQRILKATNLTLEKVNDLCSETNSRNAAYKEVQTEAIEADDVKQTDVDKVFLHKEGRVSGTDSIKSSVGKVDVSCNKMEHVCHADKVTTGLKPSNEKVIWSSSEELRKSGDHCIAELNHCDIVTGECIKKELNISTSELTETDCVEKDLNVNDLDISTNDVNESNDVSMYFSADDSLNTTNREVTQLNESDSIPSPSQPVRSSSPIRLSDKLRTWFVNNAKTANNSHEMWSEDTVNESKASLLEMGHEKGRRNLSSVDRTTDRDILGNSSTSCNISHSSDGTMQNVKDAADHSSSIEEDTETSRHSLIGMLQRWFGGSNKEKSNNRTSKAQDTEDNKQPSDEQNSSGLSISELFTDFHDDVSGCVNSDLKECCVQEAAASCDDRLYLDGANTETSKLHLTSNNYSTGTVSCNTETKESVCKTTGDDKLFAEIDTLCQEMEHANSELLNFIKLHSKTTNTETSKLHSSSNNYGNVSRNTETKASVYDTTGDDKLFAEIDTLFQEMKHANSELLNFIKLRSKITNTETSKFHSSSNNYGTLSRNTKTKESVCETTGGDKLFAEIDTLFREIKHAISELVNFIKLRSKTTNTEMKESVCETTGDNKLFAEIDVLVQEVKHANSELLNFIKLRSKTTEIISNSSSQNVITDKQHCEYKGADADRADSFVAVVVGSSSSQSCDKELSDIVSSLGGDNSQMDKSVLRLEESTPRTETHPVASPSSSSSAVTETEQMSVICAENFHNVCVMMNKEEVDVDIKLLPQLVDNDSLRPQVLWHQDASFVWLYVMLHDVKKYKLVWSDREIYFRTLHDNRVYAFKMLLFGGINPELLIHCAKGFHVEIKMFKTVQGYEWRRLLKTELKKPWLKLNLEAQADKFSSDEEDEAVGNKYKVPEDVPAPGIDIAEYDRMMFDTDEASSSSGSDVQEFDEQNLYD